MSKSALRVLAVDELDAESAKIAYHAQYQVFVDFVHRVEEHQATYNPNQADIEKFVSMATKNNYDLIYLGNNLGSGLLRAKALPKELFPKVKVVWNSQPDVSRDSYIYEALGISCFGVRPQVATVAMYGI